MPFVYANTAGAVGPVINLALDTPVGPLNLVSVAAGIQDSCEISRVATCASAAPELGMHRGPLRFDCCYHRTWAFRVVFSPPRHKCLDSACFDDFYAVTDVRGAVCSQRPAVVAVSASIALDGCAVLMDRLIAHELQAFGRLLPRFIAKSDEDVISALLAIARRVRYAIWRTHTLAALRSDAALKTLSLFLRNGVYSTECVSGYQDGRKREMPEALSALTAKNALEHKILNKPPAGRNLAGKCNFYFIDVSGTETWRYRNRNE